MMRTAGIGMTLFEVSLASRSQAPPHKRDLKGRCGSVGTSENSPVIHRRVKNAAPVKVVQPQGYD